MHVAMADSNTVMITSVLRNFQHQLKNLNTRFGRISNAAKPIILTDALTMFLQIFFLKRFFLFTTPKQIGSGHSVCDSDPAAEQEPF